VAGEPIVGAKKRAQEVLAIYLAEDGKVIVRGRIDEPDFLFMILGRAMVELSEYLQRKESPIVKPDVKVKLS